MPEEHEICDECGGLTSDLAESGTECVCEHDKIQGSLRRCRTIK